MSNPSLENKTIRPGSLLGYSYYHSSRQAAPVAKAPQASRTFSYPRLHPLFGRLLIAVLVLAALIFLPILVGGGHSATKVPTITPAASTTPSNSHATATVPAVTGPCAGNQQSLILVSISQRHLWACQGSQKVYDTPVVTGIDYLAADKTPTGTYHIYAKQTDQTLTGADSTGSWSDPVKYWMPFLNNQYGTYGLHDATWRDNSAFGNISPNSADASHGCVELPLSASAWLYNWAQVGTTVTIKS
jgi:lipoprotein-anchoring transpeptidase ErfK/SrfK